MPDDFIAQMHGVTRRDALEQAEQLASEHFGGVLYRRIVTEFVEDPDLAGSGGASLHAEYAAGADASGRA